MAHAPVVAAPSPLAPATVGPSLHRPAVSGMTATAMWPSGRVSRTDHPVRTCSGSSTVKSSVSPTVAGIAATVGVRGCRIVSSRIPFVSCLYSIVFEDTHV